MFCVFLDFLVSKRPECCGHGFLYVFFVFMVIPLHQGFVESRFLAAHPLLGLFPLRKGGKPA